MTIKKIAICTAEGKENVMYVQREQRRRIWRCGIVGILWVFAIVWAPALAGEFIGTTEERRTSYTKPIFSDPNCVPWWLSRDSYPSIDLDEAEIHRKEIEGQRVWGCALPIFAQDVIITSITYRRDVLENRIRQRCCHG